MKEVAVIMYQNHAVHFHADSISVEFKVYSIIEQSNGNIDYYYENDNGSLDLLAEFSDKAMAVMEGCTMWRGVWDERVYFELDEYWGEDFVELAKFYTSIIKNYCRQYINEKILKIEL